MKNYPFLSGRRGVWKEIVRYIHRDSKNANHVLEIGAGYCDFISQFPAPDKTCIEQNSLMKEHAGAGVNFICGDATYLPQIEEQSMDLVFASNFLEHLNETELNRIMPAIHKALKHNGQLILIQPNYRLCSEHYFDDETHQTIFDDKNITQFLTQYGFKAVKVVPDLLPFSMKSRLPKIPLLVRLYLNSPVRPFGAQMYIVAVKV